MIKGELDLSSWNFKDDGPVKLDGEWKFYWKKYYTKNELEKEAKDELTDYINLPGYWDKFIQEKENVTSTGYGTFYLKLKLKSLNTPFSIKLPESRTSMSLIVNDKKLFQTGVLGESKENSISGVNQDTVIYYPEKNFINSQKEYIDIILHIANFHVPRAGGIRGSIFIGGVQQINSLREQNLALDFFLTISFGIMGLYHISLYISRRKDPSSIFFSFLCFAIILRTISTSENILMYIFPDLTFQVVLKIRFISVIITIPSFLYFVKALFPDFSKSLPAYLSLIFTGVFSLIVIVMDSMFNIRYIQPLLSILLFITIMYIFYILVVSSINKEEGALNFLIGYIVLLITVLNDLLVTNEIILSKKNIYLAQYGIFIFIFSQVYVLSRRYSKAFTNVETLSDELEEKNQELLRLNQLKDDFLANTSHELRTPLNGIIGLADSMLKGIGGPYDKKAILNLSMISSSGRRLSHLVNDILDFSKMKNQDIVLKKVPVDLSSLVELVFEISKSLIGNKKIVLENRCLNFPPLLADENRLQQILYNLIGNAIKFTEEGTVIVSSDENNINNNEMIISVCDTGIGIPKDKHELIFETFQQAEGSISRKYGGTGLGLSITKKLIELHGGSIRVESPPVSDEFKNKFGTCFIFSIPIYQKDENVEEVKFENNKEPQITQYYIKENEFIQYSNISDLKNEIPKKSKYHVLAVDDDMVNLQVIENHLSIKNYSVTKASSGTNALQLLGSGESFDLVLLDLMMPGLNGFEVCNTIRRKFKKNELPIIILTAKNNVSDLEESLRVGGNDYLTKPFSFGELISRSENQLKMLEYFREVQELNKNLENKVTERTKELEDSKELLQKEKDILAKIVITDGLTGIHNRSYILNQLIEEYNQFKNNEKTFSTILLDIDNFKKINDTYGHQVGDIVLEGTAKFIRDKLRSFDQIGRYGGEEFLIILPDTNIDQAYKLINQIRIELSQKKWKINNLIVTFSGGLSETRFDDSEDGFDLLKRADELLYKAKNSGRNKIEFEKK